jgi:hypothetical protein
MPSCNQSKRRTYEVLTKLTKLEGIWFFFTMEISVTDFLLSLSYFKMHLLL